MNPNIKIEGVSKVEQSYSKEISFTYKGEPYVVSLYWESGEGFEINFLTPERGAYMDTPDWAVNWDEEEGLFYEESLVYTLDELTDIVLEER